MRNIDNVMLNEKQFKSVETLNTVMAMQIRMYRQK